MAANENWTVYVPDRSAPFTGFPKSLTAEEVKASLIAVGHSALNSAEMVISGDTLTFRRVQGGSKGITL